MKQKIEFSTKDVEGTFKGFFNNNYGVAVLVQEKDKPDILTAFPLNTILKKLFKKSVSKLTTDKTVVKIEKGKKPKGKKYYASKLWLDSEEITDELLIKKDFELLFN